MRIDGTYGLGPGGLATGRAQEGKSKRASQPAINDGTIPDDPEIRHRHQKYLNQARTCDQVDTQAIAEARELLKSGELASPEAISRAAQAIIDLGP